MMSKEDAIRLLRDEPVKFGQMLGFTKLTDLHNEWIIDMVRNTKDETLKAHRG